MIFSIAIHFFILIIEKHYAKAAAAASPLTSYPPHPLSTMSGLSLASVSQSGLSSTSNRGTLLATIPQIASFESFKAGGIRVGYGKKACVLMYSLSLSFAEV